MQEDVQCSTRSPDGHTCSRTQTDGNAAGAQLHAAASRRHRTAHPPSSMATHLAAPQGTQTVHPELLGAAVAHFPDRPQQRPQVDGSHRRLPAQRACLVQHGLGGLGGRAEGLWGCDGNRGGSRQLPGERPVLPGLLALADFGAPVSVLTGTDRPASCRGAGLQNRALGSLAAPCRMLTAAVQHYLVLVMMRKGRQARPRPLHWKVAAWGGPQAAQGRNCAALAPAVATATCAAPLHGSQQSAAATSPSARRALTQQHGRQRGGAAGRGSGRAGRRGDAGRRAGGAPWTFLPPFAARCVLRGLAKCCAVHHSAAPAGPWLAGRGGGERRRRRPPKVDLPLAPKPACLLACLTKKSESKGSNCRKQGKRTKRAKRSPSRDGAGPQKDAKQTQPPAATHRDSRCRLGPPVRLLALLQEQELEAMKARLADMEKEAAKLKEMQVRRLADLQSNLFLNGRHNRAPSKLPGCSA